MSGCSNTGGASAFTIGQIVRQFGAGFVDKYHPNRRLVKVLEDIGNCRTASLGSHQVACTACGYESMVYNSCGNGNCPQCQNIKKELWIDKIVKHLLPVKHFHVIFTVPHQLNDLFYYNQRKMYDLFFSSAWETIEEVTGNGRSGMVCTLHSWGSNLSYHPHVHCIVPKGTQVGGKWKGDDLYKSRFFVKVELLRDTFKKIFLKQLLYLLDHDGGLYMDGAVVDLFTMEKIRRIYVKVSKIKKWSVRIEAPICGIQQIVAYLGRYIKRVAITNSRILDINKTSVSFSYNIYAKQEQGKAAPKGIKVIEGEKFLQQFSQHILPRYFQRVRYYGIYAFTNKLLKQLAYKSLTGHVAAVYKAPLKRELLRKMLGTDPDRCPVCACYNTLIMYKNILEEPVPRFRMQAHWVNPAVKLKRRTKKIAV